jgi:RNA polymerase sigma-70 factor (ECF subfamily)
VNVPAKIFVIDDDQLVEIARTGNVEAFGELVRRYHLEIRSMLRRRIRDVSIADDLAQEVFLGAMASICRFKKESSVRSWLMSIARHKLIDHFRSETKRKVETGIDYVLDSESMRRIQAEGEPAEELIAALQACLALLNPQATNLVRRHYFEDNSASEIASQLSQHAGTVRMALMRIRLALKKCIKKKLGDRFPL